MNQDYKKAIAVFGIIIPLLIISTVVIIAGAKAKSINSEYMAKKAQYQKDQVALSATKKLQQQVSENEEQLNLWKSIMERETRGSLIEHWKTAQSKFNSEDLNKLSHNWINISTGIGANAVMPASQVKMSFSGTFRALQLSLLEFETKLPQLQLDSMTIKPLAGSNHLNVDTTFTLWTN